MTINNETNKVTVPGNGTATSFSFSNMQIQSNDQLHVTKVESDGSFTTLSEGVGTANYIVNVSIFPGTGSITYPATGSTRLQSDEELVMRAVADITQETDIQNQGGWFPEVHETVYDKLTVIDKQLQEQIDRSLVAPLSESGTIGPLPSASERANKFLGFDSNSDPVATEGTSSDPDVSGNTVVATGDTESRTLARRFADLKVPSLSSLKSINISSIPSDHTVYLLGRDSVGDEGQGIFVWNGSDLSTEVGNDSENGVYVPPNSDASGSSGSWVRQFSGPLNVKWFGARGDGATNDAAAFQGCVNYIRDNLPGGAMTVPATTEEYLIGPTSLFCTTDGTASGNPIPIRISGSGNIYSEIGSVPASGSVIKYTGSSYAIHFGTGTDRPDGSVILENFGLNGENSGANGIYIKRTEARVPVSRIENVSVRNFTNRGIYLYRMYGVNLSRIGILECGGDGLSLDNCNAFTLAGSSIIKANGGKGVRVFKNAGTAGDGEADAATANAVGLIDGILSERNGNVGISIEEMDSGEVTGCYLEGNSEMGTGLPQIAIGGANGGGSGTRSVNVNVHGNRIQGNPFATDLGITLVYGDNCRVYENQTKNHSVAGIRVGSGIDRVNWVYDNKIDEDPNLSVQSDRHFTRTMPGGGASRLRNDDTEGSTSLSSLNDLGFHLEADRQYEAEWTIYFETSGTGVGLALAVLAPAGFITMGAEIPTGSTSAVRGVRTSTSTAVTATTSDSSMQMATMRVGIETTAAGVLEPAFRVSDSSGSVTVSRVSHGVLREISW